MKRLIFLVMLAILCWGSGLWVREAMATSPTTMLDYTAVPPFVGSALPPNVLLVMDNSLSMAQSGFHNNGEVYDPTVEYGGYFDSKACYSYASNKFTVTSGTPPTCGTAWDGNFVNYLMMEKMEVAKWVMMGGKCAPRAVVTGNCYPGGTLIFESSTLVTDIVADASGRSPYTGLRCFRRSTNNMLVFSSNSCASGSSDSYTLKVGVSIEPQGVLQQVGNKARFGLMEFKTKLGDGGVVAADVGGNVVSLINGIENTDASTFTPLAESLYEAGRYFAQIKPYYANSDYSYNVTNRDPYYFKSPEWSSTSGYVPCCKSFVMIFTDGQPTQDINVPASLQDYAHIAAQHGTSVHCGTPGGCTVDHSQAPHGNGGASTHGPYASHQDPLFQDHHDNCSAYYGGQTSDPCNLMGSHYLDDVAYWMHSTDLRPESGTIGGIGDTPNPAGLAGMQNVTVYTFFAFGTGANILKDAAMVGGYDDLDGNGKPFKDNTCGTASPNALCKEWDKDGDGIPDTYFESSNAFQMRDRLLAAITDILKRSSSGTSVSILSTTEKGEGALYQAYFYPSRFQGLTDIKWLGYLHGLFLDSLGNLREDTNGNHTLDLSSDMIVKLVFDPVSGQTRAERYIDANGDGAADSTTPSEIVPLDELKPIWEAGKELALRAASDRHIYTWVDSNNDGVVDSGEVISFDSSQASLLRPYLNTTTTTKSPPDVNNPDATNVINFIRGEDVSGYRTRSITVNGSSLTWKLGDIIYSTPVTVGKPKEQYDLVYKDSSFQQFMIQYQNRRNVVYVGGNDGMLHAFNAGLYDSNTRTFDPGSGHVLGEELWAYVPYALLPHLRWLTQTDYTHVYYVDLKPKVTDVKIFTPDADHPGGWGTILIGGLRYGGGGIDVTDDFGSGTQTRNFKSSYFVLDITNPENPPVLLWSATGTDLGFTTSYPAVGRIADTSGGVQWVVLMGSGPKTYDGQRITTSPSLFSADNTGHLLVLDLTNGALLRKFNTGVSNEFLGDVVTLDGNLDYGVDTSYVGSTYMNGGSWQGNLYRVVTKNDTNPANWSLSKLYSAPGPVLAAPSISLDSFLNIWVYFGTGRFLGTADKTDTSTQTMYGIKDPCWSGGTAGCPVTVAANQLLDVSAAQVFDDESVTGVAGVSGFGELVNSARSMQGWRLDFPTAGERMLVKPIIFGGVVLFSTFTPTDDLCGFQGEGRLYATYFETGSAYKKPVIGAEASGEIKRDVSLGQGIPSMAGLHVGAEEGVRGFVQQGTGSISEIDGEPPFKFKSGVMIWEEKQM